MLDRSFARVPLGRIAFVAPLALVLCVSCVGEIGDQDPTAIGPGPDPIPRANEPSLGPAVGRRLTYEELGNAIDVTFGVTIDVEDFGLPRDNRVPGAFRNSAADLLLSPSRVRAYDEISEDVVTRMDFDAFLAAHATCQEASDPCQRGFIESAGRHIARAPLPEAELDRYLPLFEAAADEGFAAGARLVVRALIQSPRFLYRLEVQPAEPGALADVDADAFATRLAFLVWAAPPDAELRAFAEAGAMGDAQIEAQVRRMLDHPRAERALRQYVEQWLYLDAIPPGLSLAEDMKEETYRLFERLVWEDGASLMDVFTATESELSDELAQHYGLTPAAGIYDVEAVGRLGVLSHGSVLSGRTVNPSSSMIDRGLFVLNDILCESVPEPSEAIREAIEEEAVPETSGLSQRERFARQSENPMCSACHARFDPLGLPFEVFGASGEYRTEDGFGNALTGEGSLRIDDAEQAYDNPAEFAQILGGSPSVGRCLVKKSLQYAFGRRLRTPDDAMIDGLYERFVDGGGTYQNLLVAIATHPGFRTIEGAER